MRLARSVLENLEGSADVFAIMAIVVAFTFFIGMIIWVITLKKSTVEAHSRLPLSDDEDGESTDAGEGQQ